MKNYLVLAFLSIAWAGQSQQREIALVFQNQEPLTLGLSFSIKDLKKSKIDTVYFSSHLNYKNDEGVMDSLSIQIRARGNFRRNNCYFPPLRIKLKKKDVDKTPFTGNKDFKLVLPCQTVKSGDDLILKEYLCYKLLEPVTPFFFHTRLANIELTDLSGKQTKKYELKGFLIEDDDLIAGRFDGKIIDQVIHALSLNDTTAVLVDLFEYLIGNTDWSTGHQHNFKILQMQNKRIPLSYDFDMAGLVNAPYSTVNDELPITNVRQRLYRGFCRDESVMQYGRNEYIRLESEITKVIDDHKNYFSEKDYLGIKKYVEEFYTILKSDKYFKESILVACRTK